MVGDRPRLRPAGRGRRVDPDRGRPPARPRRLPRQRALDRTAGRGRLRPPVDGSGGPVGRAAPVHRHRAVGGRARTGGIDSMSTTTERFDALVIGAGAGGLSAAARLAHHGYRTLIVESRDRVGGRASSVDEDGFTVNTGAIAIEYGGVLEETFRTVGAPFDVRVPQPATLFRIKGKDI